jgi:cytochrome c oxidase subunit IV
MEADAHELEQSVRKAMRLYLFVGLLLFLATGATVAVATVPWLDIGAHGFDKWDALLGLAIASFKATLVAAIFMHLNHERKLVYFTIILASIHAIGMFAGTLWHFADPVYDHYFFIQERADGRPEPGQPLLPRGH